LTIPKKVGTGDLSCFAGRATVLRSSFNPQELHLVGLIAPRGGIITSVGDTRVVASDMMLQLDGDVTPALHKAARAFKGVRVVAAELRRLSDWRSFLSILSTAPTSIKLKLLSHSGHGIVSILLSDTLLGRNASTPLARATIRRIIGAPSIGDLPPEHHSISCPQCGLPTGTPKSLERHVARCPNGGAHHRIHHGLVNTLCVIVEEVGVPSASIAEEARGLMTGDANHHRDLVVLDFNTAR